MKELRKKIRIDIVSFLVGVLISCAVLASLYFSLGNQGAKPLINRNSEADIRAGSAVIRWEFEKKPAMADEKYKSKIVDLGGELASYDNDSAEHPYLMLSGQIKCYFDGAQEGFDKLSIEQYVTVKGICAGNIHGTIVLEHCYLLTPSRY